METISDNSIPVREAMSKSAAWARLWAIARPKTNPMLRQGAWYPVVDRGPRFVMVDVRRRYVMLPQSLVEIRSERPAQFTVVYRAAGDSNPARGTASDLGRRYAVCPVCGRRVRVAARAERTHCGNCGHQGIVAWWETG